MILQHVVCYHPWLGSGHSPLPQFTVSEVGCGAAAVRVHSVPLRKVFYELSPCYCLIVCKQEVVRENMAMH